MGFLKDIGTGGLNRVAGLDEGKRSQLLDPLDIFGGRAGAAANEASIQASQLAAKGEQDKLDYLKEVEALPLEIRNRFLPQLADVFSGGEGQQRVIDSAQQSPLYSAIMGGQQAGENAILRNAGATGGLRSGNVQGALTDYGSQLQNRALLESYNQQVQGMSGLARVPLNTNAVAGAMTGPSGVLAQGITGGAQAIQNANAQGRGNAIGIAGGLLAAFSDIRLKDNIKYIGKLNGHKMYSWDWNNEAEKLGLTGKEDGIMAHLVNEYMPEAISTKDGYLMVDYSQLNLIGVAA